MKKIPSTKLLTIGYLGLPGSFSYLAARKFSSAAKLISCSSFTQIIKQVENNKLSLGVLPIENSVAGSVVANYDLLIKSSLFIVDEVYLRISQNLLGHASVPLKNLTAVYSHPEAFNQCSDFLKKLSVQKIAMTDTASAAAYVAKNGKKNEAAIASQSAAKLYHLTILKKNIETNKHNFSRFFVIGKQSLKTYLNEADKATVVFNLQHRPGELYRALGVLAHKNFNLTKIESRPILGKPFEYFFILDFEFDKLSRAQQVISQLKNHTTFLKLLGFYPKGELNEH